MAKQNLLVADADPRSLRTLDLALRKAGFEVGTATDGAEVLRRVLRTPPDLVLCDASIPTQDGIAVCRAVRAEEKVATLPFLLMGGDKDGGVRARAMDAGADDFFPKPLLLRELVLRLRLLLDRREAENLGQRDPAATITGDVADKGLVEVLRTVEGSKRSGVIHCESPDGRSGRVWFQEGQPTDADVWPLAGEPAFYRLLTWEKGALRVEFGVHDRERRISGAMRAMVAEGVRRAEELSRTDDPPMRARLGVDVAALNARLAQLPDEVNEVLRAFDGRRTVREALDLSPVDDLDGLSIVRRLVADGVLRKVEVAASERRPSLQHWLSNPPPPQRTTPPPPPLDSVVPVAAPVHDLALDLVASEESPRLAEGVDDEVEGVLAVLTSKPALPASAAQEPQPLPPARKAPDIIRFAPQRGVRRERLRLEAEEARQRIGNGELLRLTHVVELPPWEGDGSAAIGPLRQISPAVGDAARTFAPDVPISRLRPPGEASLGSSVQPQAPASAANDERRAAVLPDGVEVGPPTLVPGSAQPRPRPVRVYTPPPPEPPRMHNEAFAAALRDAIAGKRPPRRWLWVAGGAALAVVFSWILWPQPRTERKDARWLSVDALAADAPPPVAATSVSGLREREEQAEYVLALRRGEALAERGRYKQAAAEFRNAVRLSPGSVRALVLLGRALLEADQPRGALEPLEAAAQLDPRSARAQLFLGSAYQSLGRPADAMRAYERYLELEPKGEYANEVQLVIANLRR